MYSLLYSHESIEDLSTILTSVIPLFHCLKLFVLPFSFHLWILSFQSISLFSYLSIVNQFHTMAPFSSSIGTTQSLWFIPLLYISTKIFMSLKSMSELFSFWGILSNRSSDGITVTVSASSTATDSSCCFYFSLTTISFEVSNLSSDWIRRLENFSILFKFKLIISVFKILII